MTPITRALKERAQAQIERYGEDAYVVVKASEILAEPKVDELLCVECGASLASHDPDDPESCQAPCGFQYESVLNAPEPLRTSADDEPVEPAPVFPAELAHLLPKRTEFSLDMERRGIIPPKD